MLLNLSRPLSVVSSVLIIDSRIRREKRRSLVSLSLAKYFNSDYRFWLARFLFPLSLSGPLHVVFQSFILVTRVDEVLSTCARRDCGFSVFHGYESIGYFEIFNYR